MGWLALALAALGGTVIGTAYGHRARMTAYYLGTLDGYKRGLRDGWNDAEWNAGHPTDEEGKNDDVDA